MATNNIKIFDQNKANMLTDEAYNTSTQRLNGVQQGIASSQLQNKTLYQVSLVAYAIGQMMQANGLNANDADAVSTFAGNLSNTIVQKILDKASTAEAKNFAVNNKFITPQTWKAAYDFMKADSNMVTSAVDDTHYITPKLLKEGANKFCIKEFRTTYTGDGTDTRTITFPSEPLFFIALCMDSSKDFHQYGVFYIKGMPRIFCDFSRYTSVDYTISGNTITMKNIKVNLKDYTYYLFAICA